MGNPVCKTTLDKWVLTKFMSLPNEFIISVSSFKSYLLQHGIDFINYGTK